MKVSLGFAGMVAAAAAVPDPLITPRPQLARRQESDAALLGWVDATNGQFSDLRACDFPATLSSSAALAQCCTDSACVFWQACSAGTLFAESPSTSLRCDQGYCNTAIILPTVGAPAGHSYLGCWATTLGENPFTIVRDIGNTNSPPTPSSAPSPPATSAPSSTATSGSPRQSSAAAPQSTAAAAVDSVQPPTAVFGLVALLLAML